jgi:hypothetical protein
LWNLYSKGGLPDSERLQAVRRFVDWKQVEVDAHRIRLGTGQSVTLNGIAQDSRRIGCATSCVPMGFTTRSPTPASSRL